MPGRERVILFFYTKYKLKFIAIIYTAVLKYNKAYFKKVSKVYVTVYDLITFRKSMLLYQGKRKKAGAPRKKAIGISCEKDRRKGIREHKIR